MQKMALNKLWGKSNKRFVTSSGIGGLRVGNAEFSINIPNGYGDTRAAFFDGYIPKKELEYNNFGENELRYFTCLKGTFNIYDDDCSTGNEGYLAAFGIHYRDGYIFFERWPD